MSERHARSSDDRLDLKARNDLDWLPSAARLLRHRDRMKRVALMALLVAGCQGVAGGAAGLRYGLVTIDGHPLPTVPIAFSADQRYDAASLDFGRHDGLVAGDQGTVAYTATVNGHEGTTQHHYRVEGMVLHIDLCPIGASCVAIVQELVGPIEGDQLVLTYSIGSTGVASSIFRFESFKTD